MTTATATATPSKLRWTSDGAFTRSTCGRFRISPARMGQATYYDLFDAKTGLHHVCRTVASARDAARAIVQREAR